MKRIQAAWAVLAVLSASVIGAQADRSYQSIVERNPFNVLPVPVPQVITNSPPPTNQPPKGTLKLTYMTTYFGKRAGFTWKEEKWNTNQLITLSVNQEKDGLKLLDVSIEGTNRFVRVMHQGAEKVMRFETDGITNVMVAAALPGAFPGMPGVPGLPGMVPQPGGLAPGVNLPLNRPAVPVPNAPVNTGVAPVPMPLGGLAPSVLPTPNVQMIPSRAVRTTPQPNQAVFPGGAANPAQPRISAEQQIIMMEAARMVDPSLPPTPGLPFPQ